MLSRVKQIEPKGSFLPPLLQIPICHCLQDGSDFRQQPPYSKKICEILLGMLLRDNLALLIGFSPEVNQTQKKDAAA